MCVSQGVLVMVVCERSGEMLMRMVLHRSHCPVRMGKQGVRRRCWGLRTVRWVVRRVSRPWRLVVDLTRMLMGGELVGNARGLLRIVHGIGGESRHSGKTEGGAVKGKRERERL